MKRWNGSRVAVALEIAVGLSVSAATAAGTYNNYVSLSGSDGNGGTSWVDAYKTMTNALAKASIAIDGGATDAQVYVDTGTHKQTVELVVNKPIAIIGKGGVGISESAQSIIQQDGAVRVLTLSHANARLAGLVIQNGYMNNAVNGGNVYMTDGLITNCVIRNNRYAQRTSGTGWSGKQQGGGIYMSGGLVVGSVISGNGIGHYAYGAYYLVYSYGGGVYVAGGTLRRSVILGNYIHVYRDSYGSPAYGAGIYLDGANPVVESCLIATNKSYNSSTSGSATWKGAGVYLNSGTLRNCTIVTNMITSSSGIAPAGTREGAGVYQADGTDVNCIVWRNVIKSTATPVATNYYLVSGKSATYSCAPELTSGAGNTTRYPVFKNEAAGNYRLTPGASANSPCVDKGTNQTWMATATDLDGAPRQQGRVDMGAYETRRPPSGSAVMVR